MRLVELLLYLNLHCSMQCVGRPAVASGSVANGRAGRVDRELIPRA